MWLPSRTPTDNPSEKSTTAPRNASSENQMNNNYIACLGDEEKYDSGFVCNFLQSFLDDNTVCESNTTYKSYDGTITTKEYATANVDEGIPLITNPVGLGNPVPLLKNTQHTAGKSIVQANNTHDLSMATTSISTPKMKRDIQQDLSNSGAIEKILKEGTTVAKKRPANCPIKITLSNGKTITPTHMTYRHPMYPKYYDQSKHCTWICACIPYLQSNIMQLWIPWIIWYGGVPGVLQKLSCPNRRTWPNNRTVAPTHQTHRFVSRTMNSE